MKFCKTLVEQLTEARREARLEEVVRTLNFILENPTESCSLPRYFTCSVY